MQNLCNRDGGSPRFSQSAVDLAQNSIWLELRNEMEDANCFPSRFSSGGSVAQAVGDDVKAPPWTTLGAPVIATDRFASDRNGNRAHFVGARFTLGVMSCP